MLPGEDVGDLYARFDLSGTLRLAAKPETPSMDSGDRLDCMLDLLDPDSLIEPADLQEWAEQLEITVRTVRRWVTAKIESGEIVKEGSTKGARYRKARVN